MTEVSPSSPVRDIHSHGNDSIRTALQNQDSTIPDAAIVEPGHISVTSTTQNEATKAQDGASDQPPGQDAQSENAAEGNVTEVEEYGWKWIQTNISKHLEEDDFEGRYARSPAGWARSDLVRAIKVMTYMDHMEIELEKLRSMKIPDPPARAADSDADSKSLDDKKSLADFSSERKPKWILDMQELRVSVDRYGEPTEFPVGEGMDLPAAEPEGGYILKHIHRLPNKDLSSLYADKVPEPGKYIRIMSPLIRKALRDVIFHGDEDFLTKLAYPEPIEIKEPYRPLMYNRLELQKHMETLEEEEARTHLQFLLDFLEKAFPDACKMQQEIADNKITEIESSSLSWLLYPPGSTVLVRESHSWQAYGVDSVVESGGRVVSLKVHWQEFNMTAELEEYTTTLSLAPITGPTAIASLDVVPELMHPNREEIVQELLSRGRLYWSFSKGPVFRQYTGEAWPQRDTEEVLRVVIDIFESGSSREKGQKGDTSDGTDKPLAGCSCRKCKALRRELAAKDISVKDIDTPSCVNGEAPEHILMLCPSFVRAYSLRMKTYKYVEIRKLEEIVFEESAWDKLVVSSLHKSLVTSMIESYGNKVVKMKDIVRGKGQGLVILLHGSPGTGKTLTAECVAEQQKRPLYMITCGDLGTEPSVLEEKLRTAFTIATRWDAILLLDEADVFLQERDITQLTRNALVSVFLREIEYFDGILFLTTNRPGLLDEAFQSRIHLTLSMPALDVSSQLRVWRLFLFEGRKDLNSEETTLLKEIKKATKDQTLNGRQIRNHVMTASALAAQEERDKISIDDIKKVLTISREFHQYMAKLNDGDGTKRAAETGIR